MFYNYRDEQAQTNQANTAPARKFIAVIVSKFGAPSKRSRGDWSAFVTDDRDDAIEQAVEARAAFERYGWGPYRILVGVLQTEAVVPQKYVEVAI